MAFAVIKTGGKQYLVEQGRFLEVEKIPGAEVGAKVTFDQVLFKDTGSSVQVGMPTTGTPVTGTVLEAGKDDKKVVIRYKQKSRYFKKKGHRQPYMKVMIDSI
ncbi:50S ribosomal protein L21 [Patescibacteria group bacterium]|nr:50S ribosomal protein L21 [Patescibacteria group bacterium]